MRLTLTTAPAEEPITLAEAKIHLHVDEDATTEDALITDWIIAARRDAERMTGRPLVSQTWEAKMDYFPDCNEIELPLAPLVSVTSVKYVDPDGTVQTFSSSSYTVDTSGVKGRIYLNYGEYWPNIRVEPNAVRIVFVTGYGDASTVPEDIRAWMFTKIGDRYANRESTVVGVTASKLPDIDGAMMGNRLGL